MADKARQQMAGESPSRDDIETVQGVDLSRGEWEVVRALRQFGDGDMSGARVGSLAGSLPSESNEEFAAVIERVDHEIFESVAATLDRMLARADQTSHELDALLGRLSETLPSRRPAA